MKKNWSAWLWLLLPHMLSVAPRAYAVTLNEPTDIAKNVLCPIFGWMFIILIVLSSIMAIVGAYLYVTSGGNSEKTSKATKTLTFAAVGVVVALAADAFPKLVGSIIGDDVVTCSSYNTAAPE